ncbi:hypothetical protein JCM9279_005909 [Rhodotorula babjevae]
MHPASSPSSPSKRAGLLRHLVTGVQPTDRETHAQRWQRPLLGPRAPSQDKGAAAPEPQAKGGQRVSALVQGYEASLTANSRRYEALPVGPTSPHKGTFALDIPTSSPRALADRQDYTASSPTSPSRQHSTSPTVPAAFFQRQQYRSAPAEGLLKFAPAPIGKENQPRPAPTQARVPSLPRPQFGIHPVALTPSAPSTRSPTSSDTFSSATDVSRATSALTDLTMATRSSDSTHASSLVTNSAEGAYIGVASVVHVAQDASPRKAAPTGPPQIVETAATPARSAGLPRSSRPLSPSFITSHPSFQSSAPGVDREQHPVRPDGPVPFERPLLGQRSTSSFVEALPASYPRGAPSPTSSQYQPLPLDASPRLGSLEEDEPSSATRAQARRARPRASSLGAGLKAPYAEHKMQETVEDKAQRVERDFERLLDTMQLPDRIVRTRMLGLALPLKEDMLRAAASNPSPSTSSSATLGPPGRPTHSRGRSLKLSASQSSSGSAGASGGKAKKDGGGAGSGFKSFLRKAKSGGSLRAQAAAQQKNSDKDVALAVARPASRTRSRSHSRSASGSSVGGGLFRGLGRSSGAVAGAQHVGGSMYEGEDALCWAERLQSATCAELDAKELGRLRTRLRNEAPTWVDEFIKGGGYLGLLERLKELLDMEWREEQHDDQVLYEVLRCFKALTMTACGKRALASHSPTPFLPVAALLFSEKRPGDLPSRQILVELLLALYDICPLNADTLLKSAWADSSVSLVPAPMSPVAPSSATFDSAGGSGGVRRYTRKAKSGDDSSSGAAERDEVLTPERVQQTHRLVLSLLEGPPSEDEENKVDFILAARKPRLYKTWVKEMSDTVRDYFWIFCHSDNLFWTLEQINVDQIEAPKVPSGMTGGVEHEAMTYCATHFRLINAMARACPTQQAAFDFHEQLFLSGFERVIYTLRRASLVFYQTLHLEMSRYISLARSAHFNLGPRILACLDRRFLSAEERLVLRQADERRAGAARSGSKAHTSPQGAPQIGNIF